MTDDPDMQLTDPADVAALVPYLIGYHPQNRLAVVALHETRLFFTVAVPLEHTHDADNLRATLKNKTIDQILLIGYGPREAVAASVSHAADVCRQLQLPHSIALRIHEGRLWYLHDHGPDTPEDSVPFDPTTTVAAAQATYLGLTAAPDRAVITASLDPVTGAEHDAMTTALAAADLHLARLLDGPPSAARVRIDRLLNELVTETHTGRLPDDRAALLIRLLVVPELVDVTVRHVNGDDRDIHVWTDLTRRAGTEHAAGPATVLALAALQNGDGVLAQIALDRIHQCDPDNDHLGLIAALMHHGVDPVELRRVLHP